MAKIPRAQSQVAISKEAPAVKVSAEGARRFGEDIQKTAEVIRSIGERLQQVDDLNHVVKAKTQFMNSLYDIRTRAYLDQDYNNFPRYQEEVERAKITALSDIPNEESRLQLQSAIDGHVADTMFDLRRDVHEKMVNTSKANLAEYFDSVKQNYWGSSSPLERERIKNDLFGMVTAKAELGVFDPETARKLKKNFEDSLNKGQFYYDLNAGVGDGYQFVEKAVKEDIYRFDPDEKAQAMDTVHSLQSRLNTATKEARTRMHQANESTLTVAAWDGKLTLDQVEEAMLKDAITPSVGRALHKFLTSDKTAKVVTDPIVYDKLIDMALDGSVEVSKYKEEVIKAAADGKLNETDRRRLLYNKMGPDEESASYIAANPKFLAVVWNTIKGWFKGDKKAQVEVMSNVLETAQKGNATPEQLPGIAQQALQQKTVEKFSDLSTISEEGQIRVDQHGIAAKVYSNGKVEILGPWETLVDVEEEEEE